MKIALLADIHGNLPALQAVTEHIRAWKPDQVLVAGDVINRGPESMACLAHVHIAGWQVIQGNHEVYVHDWVAPGAPEDALRRDLHQLSWWTFDQLGRRCDGFAHWPHSLHIQAPDASPLQVWHASARHNRDSIFPAPRMSDADVRPKLGDLPPPLLLIGHTHIPVVRRVDDTLIVNCGSVGLPFDRDPRACYAQLTWQHGVWHVAIVRVPYDTAAARAAYASTGYLDLPMARLVLRELELARSRLFEWSRDYEARVIAGEISISASVDAMLAA